MQSWIRIRQQLFRRLESHVRELLGPESAGTSRYRQQYEAEFRKGWKPSTRDILLSEIESSSIVCIGDFHALKQSQKAQLRILKSVPLSRSVVLAVEFFEAEHQKYIDRYLSGALSEREFLKAIQWQKNWGFPWEHYRPLIRWAQRRKAKVMGVNKRSQSRSATTLATRDQFAATQIRLIRDRHPDHLVVVLFGDLHLASGHLPRLLKGTKKLPERCLTIFQNSEKLYFQLLEKGLELEVDVVRISKNQFCLLSVPPWVKWQNYLLFLENHLDQELKGEIEYADEVARYLEVLQYDLGVKIPEGSFQIYTPNDPSFWDQVSKKFSDKDLPWLRAWVERGDSFYLPECETGFLARASVNHTAALAMAVFHSHLSGWRKTPRFMPVDFLRLVWIETVQYFGTKLINPRRKSDTLLDIKSGLAARLPDDLGKEALQLALTQKMLELLWISNPRKGPRKTRELFRPRRLASYQEAARLLGGMLGEKIFHGYRRKLISHRTLVDLVRRPVDVEQFDDFYYEALELIESLPEPFLSKTEKL